MSLNSQPEPRASRVLAEGDEGSVPRRAMLQGLATAIAGVVLPASGDVAAQAPVAPAAPPPPAGPASLPQFLSPHEQETLARIGDQLVPGSASVGVTAMADRLLSVESAEVQRRFHNALGAFEHEARVRHAKTWVELSPAEQAAILDEA